MANERLKVLVIGASGQIGQHVCRGLLERNVAVRGLAHSQAGAGRIAALGVKDVMSADLSDPETLPPVFDGVDRVMLITRAVREPHQELSAIDAAQKAGVDRIVKLSSEILFYHWDDLGEIGKASPPDMVAALHGPAEDRIRDTGIDSVMLRSTWFMSIDANPFAAPGFRNGRFVWPAGHSGLALIHPQDVGEAAVECLLAQDIPVSPVYLTGPEELSPRQIAEGFSKATATPVVTVSPSLEEYADWLETVAVMPRQAIHVLEPYVWRRSTPVTDVIEQLLNRPAKSFAEYLAAKTG